MFVLFLHIFGTTAKKMTKKMRMRTNVGVENSTMRTKKTTREIVKKKKMMKKKKKMKKKKSSSCC